MFALPGDPLATLSQGKPKNPQYLAYIADQFHLNDPFFVQYWHYITGILHGDFGKTFNGTPVLEIFKQRMPITLTLALTAFAFELVIGVGFGIWTALRKGKPIDTGALVVSLVLIATPIFVLGYLSQWLFGVKLHWFPPAGIQEGWPRSYILPGLVLASVSLAFVLRLTRQSLLEVFSTDFVRTAKAKGLPQRTIMRKYSLRNSLIPVITFLGADLAALMGGAVITEGIFNIPGIGNQIYRSIHLHESVVVVGLVTVLIIIFLIATLVVDIIYGVLDPRIRYE
jgi:peptide/nickel transport system permease protein/oligopeptide transport system permease protein